MWLHVIRKLGLVFLSVFSFLNLEAARNNNVAMTDTEVVAATMWLEASGDGFAGVRGVASVIHTRCLKHRTYPIDVCLRPKQFVCWNNRKPTSIPKGAKGTRLWNYCITMAIKIEDGSFVPSFYATHFYNPRKCKPKWAKKMKFVAKVGNHVFGELTYSHG